MNHNPLPKILRLLPLMFAFVLASCGPLADSSSKKANIRLLNLSTDYASLDLYSANEDDEADVSQFTAVTTGAISSYASLQSDDYTIKIRRTGASGNLTSFSTTLAEDTHATYVGYGATNAFGVLTISEDIDEPNSGYTTVQVVNIASSAVDVYLTGSTDSLDDVSASISGVEAGGTSTSTVSSGTFRLRVTGSGSKSDLRLNIPEVSLASEGVVSIILYPSTGGVLVKAMVLPQQGQPTTYDSTSSSEVRVLNVSSGYDSIDLYTNDGESEVDTQQLTGVARDTISSYTSIKADTYTLKFRKNGSTGNLLSTEGTLADDAHNTYVAYGITDGFAVLPIAEDETAPSSGYTKIYVLNTTTAASLDVFLTGSTDSLTDVAATVSAVAAGTSSSVTTVLSGTYRLRVALNGKKTDLRLDVPSITLTSKGIVSIILTDTDGGTAVNAVVLPQQGDPTYYENDSARIRGAVGLSTGSAATVTVGDATIVTQRSARSYIADAYTALSTGSQAVTITVDGVTVASGTVTLEAGKDYTLLAWDSSGATQLSLIEDDNHTAVSGLAKMRLINSMSALAAPLTLSLNYSPIAESIAVGEASGYYDEISAGSAYKLDVINADTLASLLSREDVTLEGSSVYTLFLAGSSSAVSGTLRKDR